MKKLILMATIISATMVAHAQSNQADEQAVRNICVTLEKAWNEKSGELFSSVFADVHDYIVVNGYYLPGFTRERNAATHQGLFDGIYKNTSIKLKIDKISFTRPDLAMINVLGARYNKDSMVPADPMAIMTILVEKKKDGWKIISFHNHEMEAFDKDRMPVPMQVMFASWYKN
ncbi:MAG TPA: SgcJ/EcaC family oxidoreductase [Chitinophagaceae bacterium]|nr:SgcJ/EcaC family oxidoreductase [Chitinophagaceae bacterium]